MKIDANDILRKGGPEELRKAFDNAENPFADASATDAAASKNTIEGWQALRATVNGWKVQLPDTWQKYFAEGEIKHNGSAQPDAIGAAVNEMRANLQALLHSLKVDALYVFLANLPELQYERERKSVAKKLGLRASVLDKMVAERRPSAKANGEADNAADVAEESEATARGAVKPGEFSTNDEGKPYNTPRNMRLALRKLGVTVRYNEFADLTQVEGLKGFGPVLNDAAINRMRLTIDTRFKFLPGKELFYDVVLDVAQRNTFHPVRDYLDGLKWDGTPRIDRWLTTYAGAEDSEFTQAVGALMLTAAVRRIRQPGCKFDEMPTFESKQGKDKSTAFRIMAVKEEWFSDDLPLNVEGKRVIEALRGKWIVEAADLKGMDNDDRDTKHLKALLSRQVDRARMAWGKLPLNVLRQCIIVGTTNEDVYLFDKTGNRRHWPIRVQGFDIIALKRDRDQLWAEAAAREAEGVSIRLDPKLWPVAEKEQAARTVEDPFREQLEIHLDQYENGKISSESIWAILDVRGGQQTQAANARMGKAMRDIGWDRPNASKQVRIDGKKVMGFVKGEPPWLPEISAIRSSDGLFINELKDEKDEKDEKKDEKKDGAQASPSETRRKQNAEARAAASEARQYRTQVVIDLKEPDISKLPSDPDPPKR